MSSRRLRMGLGIIVFVLSAFRITTSGAEWRILPPIMITLVLLFMFGVNLFRIRLKVVLLFFPLIIIGVLQKFFYAQLDATFVDLARSPMVAGLMVLYYSYLDSEQDQQSDRWIAYATFTLCFLGVFTQVVNIIANVNGFLGFKMSPWIFPAGGIFVNPNSLGYVFGFSYALSHITQTKLRTFLIKMSAVLGSVLATDKTVLLAIFMSEIVWYMKSARRKLELIGLLFFLGVSGLGLIYFALPVLLSRKVVIRVAGQTSVLSFSDYLSYELNTSGVYGRFWIWKGIWKAFSEHPGLWLLGNGSSEFSYQGFSSGTHNFVLAHLMLFGIIVLPYVYLFYKENICLWLRVLRGTKNRCSHSGLSRLRVATMGSAVLLSKSLTEGFTLGSDTVISFLGMYFFVIIYRLNHSISHKSR